jgi:hypothetical protein
MMNRGVGGLRGGYNRGKLGGRIGGGFGGLMGGGGFIGRWANFEVYCK